jgi:hypothetical protein
LVAKPVLDGDIFSVNPAKFVQLLPKRIQESCHTRSSASIQEPYAGDFPCLLRAGDRNSCQKESCQPDYDLSSLGFVPVSLLTPDT